MWFSCWKIKKIIKIRSRTPATANESERSNRGPSRDHQESNEVRVTLLFDDRDNIPQTCRQTSPSSPSDNDSAYGKSTVSPTTARAREALAIDLVAYMTAMFKSIQKGLKKQKKGSKKRKKRYDSSSSDSDSE